jgi:hypothetical protein
MTDAAGANREGSIESRRGRLNGDGRPHHDVRYKIGFEGHARSRWKNMTVVIIGFMWRKKKQGEIGTSAEKKSGEQDQL